MSKPKDVTALIPSHMEGKWEREGWNRCLLARRVLSDMSHPYRARVCLCVRVHVCEHVCARVCALMPVCRNTSLCGAEVTTWELPGVYAHPHVAPKNPQCIFTWSPCGSFVQFVPDYSRCSVPTVLGLRQTASGCPFMSCQERPLCVCSPLC